MMFDSYYWHAGRVRPELEQARERLAAGHDRAAFKLLLRSGDPVAVAIALDHYHRADASTRHGTPNPFEDHRDEVIAVARDVLRGAPTEEREDIAAGANYASALGALMNLAEPQDAVLIVAALERVSTSELRFAAAAAASTLLERSPDPDERLIAALEAVALDDTAGRDAREAAASAVGRTRSAAATHAVLRFLDTGEFWLQAVAALHLLDIDRRAYRARVEQIVRGWPEPPPYPGDEVLELLAEADAT
ncbi:MAG TPA: hypothetical protein VF516_45115 [Kofleriaceae bacterium]